MKYPHRPIRKYLVRVIFAVISIVILIPLLMALIWFIRPSHPLNVLIMDKTVLDQTYREHAAITWTLRHEKFVRPDGSPYHRGRDYMGFFPGQNQTYTIHDVQGFTMQNWTVSVMPWMLYIWQRCMGYTKRTGFVISRRIRACFTGERCGMKRC